MSVLWFGAGCARAEPGVRSAADLVSASAPAQLELVETFPVETNLDHLEIADAAPTWLALVSSATESIEFAEFYGASAPGGQLEPLLEALEAQAARGVKVRFVFDRKFYEREPAVPDRLEASPGIEVRIADYGAATGGVLHAKYFVIDRQVAYLGSQNFDWRSLEHIQELGVLVRHPDLVAALAHAFDVDWALGAGATVDDALAQAGPAPAGVATVDYHGMPHDVQVVLSPKPLCDEARWDLPHILATLAQAKHEVRIQLMSYSVTNYDKSEFHELEQPLHAAAGRGVTVHLLLADWNKKEPTISQLQQLQQVEGIEIRLVTIPQWSGGFIPYARVVHAKYMTVDGQESWVGTSNWSGDYFYASRNVGVMVGGALFAGDLEALFDGLWASTYAVPVDPQATYEPPRVSK